MPISSPDVVLGQSKTSSPGQQQAKTLALQLAHISTVYIQLLELGAHGRLLLQNGAQPETSKINIASDKPQHQPAASTAHTAQPGQRQNCSETNLGQQAQHISPPCILAYQQELVDVILKKKNSVLFLPTGDCPNLGSFPA